jgi:hypothetical protein
MVPIKIDGTMVGVMSCEGENRSDKPAGESITLGKEK